MISGKEPVKEKGQTRGEEERTARKKKEHE
jgi:hypothetical protein